MSGISMTLRSFMDKHGLDYDKDFTARMWIQDVWMSEWHQVGYKNESKVWERTEQMLLEHSDFVEDSGSTTKPD